MELKCDAQNYDWGKLGRDSLVAKLLKGSNPKVKINKDLPYAELWMGCHQTMPSILKKNKDTLQKYIEKNPKCLGDKVINKFGKQLPFLFKVLSINKALSIQAHPSKKLAEELHAKSPELYKDSNYKPEMAIALTPFEALCGFRPACEIKAYLKAVPELKNLVQSTIAEDDFQLIKNAFKSVLQTSKDKIQDEVNNLIERVSRIQNDQQKIFENVELIKRLNEQFPGDVGIFMVYFLNYIKLNEGEAIYLGECEPHAYISGDCIECMACSDNVVRAGLTPKFIDVDTLISMLTYKTKTARETIFESQKEDNFTVVFKPPVPDFSVAHIKIPKTHSSYTLIKRETASIIIIISGEGNLGNMELNSGSIFFIPANEAVTITLKENLDVFQAFVNI